jgi:4-diphosphocytidyl-2-C-methyl-D-erythritol kinase
MPSLTIFAPAKINLYLHVTGRREDGYHLLDSLVGFAAIGDRLTVASAASFEFTLTGPFAPALANTDPNTNLVVRAARALATATGRDLPCRIILEKNLPLASGIGGGSSDAAAVLLALALLWDLPSTALPLAEIARSLGQDVAACLYRRSCYFRGVGDVVEPAPELPSCGIVLINPMVQVPTPAVFKARSGKFSAPAPLVPTKDLEQLASQLRQRRNDLYEPAVQLAPEIGDCLSAVAAAPDCVLARMSGSGATCFGLFASLAHAEAARQAIAARHPGWWTAAGAFPFKE